MKRELKRRTRHISNYDYNVLLPILIKGLEMKKGRMNAVTNREIVHALQSHGLKINHADVTSLINHIRTNDLIIGLVATNSGYYTTNSEQDIMNYENTLLGREMEIRKVRMSIERQRRKLFAPRPLQLF